MIIKVKAHYADVKSIAKAAAINGISYNAAKKYIAVDKESLQAKLNFRLEKFALDKYANIIYKMLKDGFSIGIINRYLHNIDKTIDFKETAIIIKRISNRYFNRDPVNKRSIKKQTERIKRSEILKYLTTIHKKKSKKIRRYWPIIKKEFPLLQELERAYRYFHNCLNEKSASQIDSYIAEYINNKIPEIKSFAKGLIGDLTAIKEGIKTGITSGLIEGGNNKIKLIKRLGYGRMKYPRLKQKILTVANFFNT